MDPNSAFDFSVLALAVWREARGENLATKQAVAWSIRNRVTHPGWWGKGWAGVVLHPFQYSSFNDHDINATKWPYHADPHWLDALTAAGDVYSADLDEQPMLRSDPTNGSTHYFDMSLDQNPPSWARDGSLVHVVDFGRLHFWRKA